MKSIFGILLLLFFSNQMLAQGCEDVLVKCNKLLKSANEVGEGFVSDGQILNTSLESGEVAKFNITFFGGTKYRLTTSAENDNLVLFKVFDQERNLLFTNADHNHKAYWNFMIENTINCYIEAEILGGTDGVNCMVILLGFQR